MPLRGLSRGFTFKCHKNFTSLVGNGGITSAPVMHSGNACNASFSDKACIILVALEGKIFRGTGNIEAAGLRDGALAASVVGKGMVSG